MIKNELFINGTFDSVSVQMGLSLMMMKSVLPDCKTPIALTVGAAQEIPESNIPPKIVSGVFCVDTGCLQQGLQMYPVFQTLRHKSLTNKILALVLHAVKDIIGQALGNEYRYSICMHCFRSLLMPRRQYSS